MENNSIQEIYLNEIFNNMEKNTYNFYSKIKEINFDTDLSEYLLKRSSLIVTLRKICNKFNFKIETYFLSIHYLDIVMLENQTYKIVFKNFTSLAISCLSLAAKFIENDCDVPQLTYFIQAYKKVIEDRKTIAISDLIYNEVRICKILKYKINYFTIYDFNLFFIKQGIILNNNEIEKINYDKNIPIETYINKLTEKIFKKAKNYVEIFINRKISLKFNTLLLSIYIMQKSFESVLINEYKINNKVDTLNSIELFREMIQKNLKKNITKFYKIEYELLEEYQAIKSELGYNKINSNIIIYNYNKIPENNITVSKINKNNLINKSDNNNNSNNLIENDQKDIICSYKLRNSIKNRRKKELNSPFNSDYKIPSNLILRSSYNNKSTNESIIHKDFSKSLFSLNVNSSTQKKAIGAVNSSRKKYRNANFKNSFINNIDIHSFSFNSNLQDNNKLKSISPSNFRSKENWIYLNKLKTIKALINSINKNQSKNKIQFPEIKKLYYKKKILLNEDKKSSSYNNSVNKVVTNKNLNTEGNNKGNYIYKKFVIVTSQSTIKLKNLSSTKEKYNKIFKYITIQQPIHKNNSIRNNSDNKIKPLKNIFNENLTTRNGKLHSNRKITEKTCNTEFNIHFNSSNNNNCNNFYKRLKFFKIKKPNENKNYINESQKMINKEDSSSVKKRNKSNDLKNIPIFLEKIQNNNDNKNNNKNIDKKLFFIKKIQKNKENENNKKNQQHFNKIKVFNDSKKNFKDELTLNLDIINDKKKKYYQIYKEYKNKNLKNLQEKKIKYLQGISFLNKKNKLMNVVTKKCITVTETKLNNNIS